MTEPTTMTYRSPETWADLIRTITTETGYPPSPEELAEITGLSTRSLHSSLLAAKNRKLIRYDDNGHLIASAGS